MSIEIHYPGVYDNSDEVDAVIIKADFYLIGPARHYCWKGTTIEEAVSRAAYDIDSWIKESESIL
jgi:hypothetical protein